MNQIKGFHKKATKFENHLNYISDIMDGDISRIDPNMIPKDSTLKHKFGERIYNY